MKFKAKQTLVLGLVGLLLVAGYYRWTTQKAGDMSVAVGTSREEDAVPVMSVDDKGYFAESRQAREVGRSQALELANGVIENPDATVAAKDDAQKTVAAITASVQNESLAESLIKSKGYEDCVILTAENGEVSVVVKGAQLDSGKVNQIKDIVVSQMGVKATQIKISNYEG